MYITIYCLTISKILVTLNKLIFLLNMQDATKNTKVSNEGFVKPEL